MDGRRAPSLARRRRNALRIQSMCDRLGRHAGLIVGKDAAHHLRLGDVDLPAARFDFAVLVYAANNGVAVAVSAAGLYRFGLAAETSKGLVGQVLEEERA